MVKIPVLSSPQSTPILKIWKSSLNGQFWKLLQTHLVKAFIDHSMGLQQFSEMILWWGFPNFEGQCGGLRRTPNPEIPKSSMLVDAISDNVQKVNHLTDLTWAQAVTTCGSDAARKWGENKEMERERLPPSPFPLSLTTCVGLLELILFHTYSQREDSWSKETEVFDKYLLM